MRVSPRQAFFLTLAFVCLCIGHSARADETFRIGTYNVENYLGEKTGTRPIKSEAAKAKVIESLLAMKPDVLALEEMGTTNVLQELQAALKTNGLDLPYWEFVNGFDSEIHIAILSRFPIIARRPHTNDSYVLDGKELQVSRGFAEVDIRPTGNFVFTLIGAHLKSKRPVLIANEAEMRLEEATLLRTHVDNFIRAHPAANLIVLGDFNDFPGTEPIKCVIGKGKTALIDTRPAELGGDVTGRKDRRLGSREVVWTHFYAKDDTYSRIDYILLNRQMAKKWQPELAEIVNVPGWGVASDHRPLVVRISTK